jgi:hypothetical protein
MNEWEKMRCEEVVVYLSYYPSIQKSLGQHNRPPYRDTNRGPSNYVLNKNAIRFQKHKLHWCHWYSF